MSQAKVERSVTVNNDMSWHVHVAGRLVEISANNVLKEFPCHMKDLHDIVHCVERSHVCPGNPQTDFVEVVPKRGGATTGKNGRTVPFVDCVGEVIDVDGQVYGQQLSVNCSVHQRVQYPHDARVAGSTVHSYMLLNHVISRLSAVDGQLMTATATFDTLSESESMQRFKSLQKQRKM